MAKLISGWYLRENQHMHEQPGYGSAAWKYAGIVRFFMNKTHSETLLDYGCGKGGLKDWLPDVDVTCYDPAVKEYAQDPNPADFTACLDVMEHIEPDYLDNVIQHIAKKTDKAALFIIAGYPAKKILRDGRNAHLIQETVQWWVGKIAPHFSRVLVVEGLEKNNHNLLALR